MTDRDMQEVAVRYGHESVFVFPPPEGSRSDFGFRFWVPSHEMEMCGHATVGALWLLANTGALRGEDVTVSTLSGEVPPAAFSTSSRITRGASGVRWHAATASASPGTTSATAVPRSAADQGLSFLTTRRSMTRREPGLRRSRVTRHAADEARGVLRMRFHRSGSVTCRELVELITDYLEAGRSYGTEGQRFESSRARLYAGFLRI
jgi:hypothetical protein